LLLKLVKILLVLLSIIIKKLLFKHVQLVFLYMVKLDKNHLKIFQKQQALISLINIRIKYSKILIGIILEKLLKFKWINFKQKLMATIKKINIKINIKMLLYMLVAKHKQ